MEHPGAPAAEDGLALLFDGTARDEPRQRALSQLLVILLGWAVVIALVCGALIVAAPAWEAIVVDAVKALLAPGVPAAP